jgi:glyoxylate carboligase
MGRHAGDRSRDPRFGAGGITLCFGIPGEDINPLYGATHALGDTRDIPACQVEEWAETDARTACFLIGLHSFTRRVE